MIIPVVNMDITPLVQFLIAVSYVGLVYMLSVELIGHHPFRVTKKSVPVENVPTENAEIPPATIVSPQRKANLDEGKCVDRLE